MADTLKLTRADSVELPGGHGEGETAAVYAEKGTPRVAVVRVRGETGFTIVAYFIAGPGAFVAVGELRRYELPINMTPKVKVDRRFPFTMYVCGDSALSPLMESALPGMREDVAAILEAASHGKRTQ